MNKPFFSVVIPTYNRENIISESIKSVLEQSYKDFELIIIDNGSNDNTKDLVENFNDSRIRYHWQEGTGGPAGPRNTGIKLSKSDWISFLDSDDLWLPEKLEEVKKIIDNAPEAILIHHSAKALRDGKMISSKPFAIKNLGVVSGKIVNHLLTGESTVKMLTATVKKNVLISVGGFNESNALTGVEDLELWIRIAKKNQIHFINKELAVHRDYDDNLLKQINLEKKLYEIFKLHVSTDNKALTKKTLSFVYYTSAIQYYSRGEMRQARIRLNKALMETPCKFVLYEFYFKSLLGAKLSHFIRYYKRKFT